VWSDHQNLQGFMKQPRINGRQARWLVYLTLYDFRIYHRPGLLNPADGPSRRPDYMATAQKEPGLLQNDLLAGRLAESNLRVTDIPLNPDLQAGRLPGPLSPANGPPRRPDLTGRAGKIPRGLCKIARCQLCEAAWVIPEFPGPRPVVPDRPNNCLPEAELCDTARATRRVNAPSPLVDSKGQ
jgi:hypothetical protein